MNTSAILAFLNKYKWQILIIVGVLVLIYVLRRNWYKIKAFFQPVDVDLEGGGTSISPQREIELKALAKNIYTDLYDTPFGGLYAFHDLALYKQADALTDVELIYLAKYYKRSLSAGNTLYEDIDSDYFSGDEGTKLMSHLSKVGER